MARKPEENDTSPALRDIGAAVQLLAEYRPRRKLVRRILARSAVGLYLGAHLPGGLSVLLIKRADREGDRWSGHMAFPGGRKDRGDRNTLATAKRETMEEVGLDADRHARLIGRLSDIPTHPPLRGGAMIITPYVFHLHAPAPLTPNHEVAGVVWVPLPFLADRANREMMRWAPNGVPLQLPCYMYGEHRIWGLSLMMLDELLDALA
jgi:8-oxo-dGTP pyrophosphatase MutT (NUDIX family)